LSTALLGYLNTCEQGISRWVNFHKSFLTCYLFFGHFWCTSWRRRGL